MFKSAIYLVCLSITLALVIACTDTQTKSHSTASTPRIVSLDYCADQFVLQLVPPAQIAGVSPDADKYFSYMRHRAANIRKVRSAAEDVLSLQPTHVVRSYGGGPNAAAFFKRAGIEVVQLDYVDDLAAVKRNIRKVARQLQAISAGQALIDEVDQRLSALTPVSRKPETLYLTPGGVTTGPGSLVHELMTTAGLGNYEKLPGWRSISLEHLVHNPPELIAAARFGDPSTHVDPWTLARHPLVENIVATVPAVELEGAWTSCGGWFLMDAVEAMNQAASTYRARP